MEASEAVATDFVGAIEAAFEPVCHFPFAAPARDQLCPGLRVTFHGTYAIYYRPLIDAVVIIRVLHGARDVAALAEHGGFAG
jgi:toxin ParE1/3/4